MITMPTEAYQKAQADSGLKAGDLVRVTRKIKSREEGGWNVEDWKSEMDPFVGERKGRKIMSVDSLYGIHIQGANRWVPFFILERTDADGNPLYSEQHIEGAASHATIFESTDKRTAIIGNGQATLIGQFTKADLKKFIDSASW